MDTPETYALRIINVIIAHGEAFQLMLYRAEDGDEAWFWNSRDGVTPFGTTLGDKIYRHAMGDYSPRYMAVLPDKAQYAWVTHTPETWRAMNADKFERFAAKQDEYGEHFRSQFQTLDDWLAIIPFEHG